MMLFELLRTIYWIKSQKNGLHNLKIKVKKDIYILIPVLREQKRIILTLKYFLKHFNSSNIHIFVITTQKEYDKKITGKTTQEVVRGFIAKNDLTDKIKIFNYSGNGRSAGQFNFAISKITDNNSFIAAYNADSRPNPKTFQLFWEELIKYPNAQVFQQSAIFLRNFEKMNGSFLKQLFLQTAAVLQTEFTLLHEIPAFLRQSISKNSLLLKYANAYCVSHGLIMNTGLLKSVGGFPEKTITEDIFLGFLLRSKSINIYPFPILENADSPATLKGLWDQKYVWFWGPMRYYSYFNFVRKHNRELKVVDIKIPFSLLIQGLWSGLGWISIGFVIVLFLTEALLVSKNLPVILLFIFLSYPLRFMIICYFSPLLYEAAGSLQKSISLKRAILIGIMSVPLMIFHSIPPLFSVVKELEHQLLGREIYKPKTDD